MDKNMRNLNQDYFMSMPGNSNSDKYCTFIHFRLDKNSNLIVIFVGRLDIIHVFFLISTVSINETCVT